MSKENPQTKRNLEDFEKDECAKLKAIYSSKAKALGVNQTTIGDKLGITQAAISNYLNGINALNLKTAVQMANSLEVDISDFSERLNDEAKGYQLYGKTIQKFRELVESLDDDDLKEIIAMIEAKIAVRSQKQKT